MASFRSTLKHCLLHYPTIFPNPADACVHLFAVIGNGYEWKNGQLVDRCYPLRNVNKMKMKYPVPDERLVRLLNNMPDSVNRFTGIKLRENAELTQMKWMAKNIDAVLDACPTNVYFGGPSRSHYLMKGISTEYAHAFDFPDDIKKDWAKALYQFLDWWLVQLNHEYSTHYTDWPEDIMAGRVAILSTRVRLHPYAHNGQTFDQEERQSKDLIRGIVAQIKTNN